MEHYITIVSNRVYLGSVVYTLRFGFIVTGVTLLLSYPIAYTLTKISPGRLAAYSLIILSPLFVNLVVRAYGWIALLSKYGAVNSTLVWLGWEVQPSQLLYTDGSVLVGMVHVLSPYMILSIFASLSTLDPALPDAAANLGASSWQTFLYITLPLSIPGIVAGATVVFTSSVSAYVLPLLLGGIDVKLVSTLLYQQVMILGNYPFGSALAATIYILTFLSLVVSSNLIGQARPSAVGSV
jgi:putative spermidine/putrescine transport system permease protein